MALTKIPANLLSGVDLPDSTRLNLGSDNDLALFHTGGNGVIHNTTGALRIRANTLNIQDYSNEDAMITATSDGSVELYHNNVKKLETLSTGINVIGNVGSATMSTTGDTDFGGRGDFAKDLRIRGDGSNANQGVVRFHTNSNGQLFIDPANDGNNQFLFNTDGSLTVPGNLTVNGTTVTLNTSTLTVDDKIITVADGAADAAAANESGINVAGASATVLYKSGNDRWEFNKEAFTAFGFMTGTSSTDVGLVRNSSGVFDFQAQSGRSISFSNVTNGEHVRIDADGKVGIGTQSPAQALDVVGAIKLSDGILSAGQAGSASVFNEDGTTADFRVESTNNTHSLFVDGGLGRVSINSSSMTADGLTIGTNNSNCELDLSHSSGKRYRLNSRSSGILSFENKTDGYGNILAFSGQKVGIGTDAPAGLLTIAGSGDAIRVESSNGGAGGAQMDLLHFSGSPANEDTHGAINFGGYYSGSSSAYGSAIRSIWTNVGGREGRLEFLTRDDSNFNTHLTIRHDGHVVIGNSTDERITIGQTGTPGTNSSNWIRAGNGVDMMFNAASGDHRWEIAGTQHMILKASQTASTAMLRLDDTHPWIDLVAPDGQFWRGGMTMRGGSSSTQAQCHFHMCRHADMKKLSTAGDYDAYIVTESANAAAYGDFLIGTDGTEAMRFHAAGQEVSIGNTGRVGSSAKSYLNVGSFSGSSTISICSSSSGYGYLNFADGTSGAGADPGYMRYNHNDNTFYFNRNVSGPSFSSDQFLKENIVDLDGGLSVIKSLRPRKFDWKKDNLTGENLFGLGTEMAGFIAQEVEDYLPNEVHGEHGSKGISPMGIIAHLVKAVQQLEEEIERLKG